MADETPNEQEPKKTHMFMGGYEELPGGGQVPKESVSGVPARDLFDNEYQDALNVLPRIRTEKGVETDIPEPDALKLLERLYKPIDPTAVKVRTPKTQTTTVLPAPDEGKEAS